MINEFAFGPFWQEVPQVRGVHWRANMTFDILTDLRPTLEVSMFEKMHHNSPSAQEYQTNVLKVSIQNVNVSVFPPLYSKWTHGPSCHACVGSVSLTHHSQSSRSQAILSFLNTLEVFSLFKICSYFFSFLCKRNLHYCVCVCVCVRVRVCARAHALPSCAFPRIPSDGVIFEQKHAY